MKKRITFLCVITMLLFVTANTIAQDYDFVLENCSFTYNSDIFTFYYDFRNTGPDPVLSIPKIYGGVFFSLDAVLDTTIDYLAATFSAAGILGNFCFCGQSFFENMAGRLIPSGTYYVLAMIDYRESYAETDETNNIVNVGTINYNGTATSTRMLEKTQFNERIEKVYGYSGKLYLSVFLSENGIGDIHIYDIIGRETAIFNNMFLVNGKNDLSFDLPEISNGVYFYTFSLNGQRKSGKILITN